jgi:hypothetical protein
MFVLNPDPYLLPTFRISPFKTADLAFNATLPDDNFIEKYFNKRFSGKSYQFTLNGREALSIALNYYRLQNNDIVTILTTSGNFYISACVTNGIEKFCKWSRQIERNTKLILVNHEFGYPYKGLTELIKTGIPIIEDCAHSFFSDDENGNTGKVGNFVIYSFPKMFPLQIGGLLVSNQERQLPVSNLLVKTQMRYIKNVLSHHLKNKEEIVEKRLINYLYLSHIFEEFGLLEYFQFEDGIVPGVFMFRTNKKKIDLPELKKHFYAHGVQCSVFYGENAFFIPVHQALNEQDMLYFYEVTKSFIHKTEL